MKSRAILRMQFLMVGLSAVFLLPAFASAQEITNSEFDDGPYVVPFSQLVSSEAAPTPTPAPAPASILTESQAQQAAAAMMNPTVPEVTLLQTTVVERWLAAVLLITIALLAMFILVQFSLWLELKRARRNLRGASNPRVSAGTA